MSQKDAQRIENSIPDQSSLDNQIHNHVNDTQVNEPSKNQTSKQTNDQTSTPIDSPLIDSSLIIQNDEQPSIVPAPLNNAPVIYLKASDIAIVGIEKSISAEAFDADADELGFLWKLASTPKGSATTLQTNTSSYTLVTPDIAGAYLLELTVNDGKSSATKSMELIATTENIPPRARIDTTSDVVASQTTVALSGAGSRDEDGDTLSYTWTMVSRPAGSQATLSNLYTVETTFHTDVNGSYNISLQVRDDTSQNTVTKTIYASSYSLDISWPANPDGPDGYSIYIGEDISNINELLTILVADDTNWEPASPSVTIGGETIISALPANSKFACFSIRAYNAWGYSDASDASCITLP
ncbi:MAG: PKD domain-containing protein [Gammaproteobacteria bacterium]|nr:PKD domain-containing protein [Gammaproteobacteria bacterium]